MGLRGTTSTSMGGRALQRNTLTPPWMFPNDEKYQGDAYGTYAWAAYVAEVSVDTVTYESRAEDFIAVEEVGHAMHAVAPEGSDRGRCGEGIGCSLYENVVWSMAGRPTDK